MDQPYRPRVSRETRLLITTAVLSIAVLWVLARIRFPERPVTPNPVAPLLTQLGAEPAFDDLASEIDLLQARLTSSLLTLPVPPTEQGQDPSAARYPLMALRLRADVAVTMFQGAALRADEGVAPNVIAHDPASGLAVIRVPSMPPAPFPPWLPQRLEQPHYFVASDVSVLGTSLRPVFVGSLHAATSPAWPGTIWAAPAGANFRPGAFVFTSDGALVGLVVSHEGGQGIVPAQVLLAEVDRLLARPETPRGWLGVAVETLTPALAKAIGVAAGVVVTAVDARSPAAGQLTVGAVIEALDGEILRNSGHWELRIARVAVGDTVSLRVRGRGEVQEVALKAVARPPAAESRSLGLVVRGLPRRGVEIIRIEPGSAAERAGLEAGDVITLVGSIPTPNAAQIRTAFASLPAGAAVLVGFTRGETPRVSALEKK